MDAVHLTGEVKRKEKSRQMNKYTRHDGRGGEAIHKMVSRDDKPSESEKGGSVNMRIGDILPAAPEER
jgi:hypothetical protein